MCPNSKIQEFIKACKLENMPEHLIEKALDISQKTDINPYSLLNDFIYGKNKEKNKNVNGMCDWKME
jgi:hypothetical protein